jgi:DNA-binding transcriptional ArsR family regulator
MGDKDKQMDDVREQLRKLQEQMDDLRDKLRDQTHEEEEPPKGRHEPSPIGPEFEKKMEELGGRVNAYGKGLGQYISMVVNDVMRGVDRTLRNTVLVGRDGRRIYIHKDESDRDEETAELAERVPPEEAERLLSPLASAERIRILYLLSDRPRYHQDLMEESKTAPGTLPHHLKQLEDAGYVTQERVRGRYLITIPGRMALKLAEYLHNQMQEGAGGESDVEDKDKRED